MFVHQSVPGRIRNTGDSSQSCEGLEIRLFNEGLINFWVSVVTKSILKYLMPCEVLRAEDFCGLPRGVIKFR